MLPDLATLAPWSAAAAGVLLLAPLVRRRLQLSMAKHPSLTGHSRMAKRLAGWLPGGAYDAERFFAADGAPADVVTRRRNGMGRLADLYARRYPQGIAITGRAREQLSDLQFTSAYRVPFQFSPYLRQRLTVPAFAAAAQGGELQDLDGNRLIDLTGSYGVNVFGHDFYRACMADGLRRAADMGVVLGAYHPSVASNVQRLCQVSGLDEVSFHMSGTEAVMQAVRLSRYHTGRSHLVRFCGAYHGWWDDVQPGPGTPAGPRQTYTLRDMDERSLAVLRQRKDIACVLVNPLQALHPNASAPGDSSLVDGGRRAQFDREATTRWLKALRAVCTQRGIVLIFDEVFLGFRLAPGGAQAYFGVRADMVTYGKTVAGGFPVGVVCGRGPLMKRYRDDRPADLCFARGTFNAHPVVMGGMAAFFERIDQPDVRALYDGLDDRFNAFAGRLNAQLREASLPVQVANLSSIFTVMYSLPSRYHWMLQFYLRAEGLALSWVGTGRLIFPINTTEAQFDEVARRFVAAGRAMQADSWWWHAPGATNQAIRRGLLREALRRRLAEWF
ncbi:MAG: aminotransferase class III-fold pyridoxal phosphate-dependent enzyme [Ideonella sp.]|nr:aminotransferase class III-fold pyridoxal phosphate-dependent enzyme [Ideonella sp.]